MYIFWRIILIIVFFTAIMPFTPFFAPTDVQAACDEHIEAGDWVNTDSNTNRITRVGVFPVSCESSDPHPGFYIHLWDKCSPTDCDWGKAPANRISTGQIYAVYYQGSVKRNVWISMSKEHPGKLWVAIKTAFTDQVRPEINTQDWFSKVKPAPSEPDGPVLIPVPGPPLGGPVRSDSAKAIQESPHLVLLP